jgi:predicted metal-binding membrane protein
VVTFAAGYFACWFGFSVVAVALQFALERLGLVDGMTLWSVNGWLTGALFLAAALYQLSPLKAGCLTHCRSPAAFLARHRRPGTRGVFRLGLIHGAYCVGCCWVLMLLLFAAGIMNLVWIAGLAIFVLIEKVSPFAARLAPLTAGLLAAAGLYAMLAV